MLKPTDVIPSWRSIEIRRLPGGACEVHLSNDAAALATAASISEISLSMSHDATLGLATVVGVVDHSSAPDVAA
jgi:phosphopantetheinyl transferase (holo-ACP synthase)